MKKLIFISVLFLSISIFSQETEFKLTKDGFTDYIVTSTENKSSSDLYTKTLNWIKVTYKNPDEVINSKIENEYIRFTGAKPGLVSINALGRNKKNTRYTIEVSFKDGRYKFDLIKLEYYEGPSQYTRGGWSDINLEDPSYYFKKNGSLKGPFKYHGEIPEYFNNLNSELLNFILGENIPSKTDEW